MLLPGKSHGQKSLIGYSPWGCKESDMTERLHFTISSPGKRTGVIIYHFIELGLFPGGSEVKVSACNVGDLGSILIPGSATHSSILAWRIPWTEEPMGSQSRTRLFLLEDNCRIVQKGFDTNYQIT